jgi:hypothetical protein
MMVLVPLLRVVTFLLGIVQLVWIARYAYEHFGGIIGVVVAWLVFPLTLIVSPIYGVLAHGDWLGVLLFAIGPVTYLLLGLLVASRIGDRSDDGLLDTKTIRDRSSSVRPPIGGVSAQSVPSPSSPPPAAQMPAREPYRDAIDLQIDGLAISHALTAERLRRVREQARQFSLDTNVWLAADAIWTIVQAAWPDDKTDAFFAARDEAKRRLDKGDAELSRVAEAVVTDISDLASTAIRGSAMIGSSYLDFDEQNRADDRAMWQAGGAHHVARAAVLAHVLGDQLDEATTSLLQLPWLALCETSEDDRDDLIAAAEENTCAAFRAVADDRVLFKEPDQPRTALVQLLEPLDYDPPADEDDEPEDDDASFDEEDMNSLFGERQPPASSRRRSTAGE